MDYWKWKDPQHGWTKPVLGAAHESMTFKKQESESVALLCRSSGVPPPSTL